MVRTADVDPFDGAPLQKTIGCFCPPPSFWWRRLMRCFLRGFFLAGPLSAFSSCTPPESGEWLMPLFCALSFTCRVADCGLCPLPRRRVFRFHFLVCCGFRLADRLPCVIFGDPFVQLFPLFFEYFPLLSLSPAFLCPARPVSPALKSLWFLTEQISPRFS